MAPRGKPQRIAKINTFGTFGSNGFGDYSKVVIVTKVTITNLDTLDGLINLNLDRGQVFWVGRVSDRLINLIFGFSVSDRLISLNLDRRRKPKPGLLIQLQQQFDIAWKDTVFIGDSIRDLQAAESVGCHAILVATGNGQHTMTTHQPKVPFTSNLLSAANRLLTPSFVLGQ